MKKSSMGRILLLVFLFAFTLISNQAMALKNVCPECKTLVEDLELTACQNCGLIMNRCLICGKINPIKNDNCDHCFASLAESRVLQTIDKEVRKDLRLGESARARHEVELQQIEEKIKVTELTPELAKRQIELLTKMGWWSQANKKGIEFEANFPDEKSVLVSVCRCKALRNLGFLAIENNEFDVAIGYLKTALAIDPKDKKSANLLKVASDAN